MTICFHLIACCSELARKGVELVEADWDDVKSLKRVFEGAYGVFGVTGADCKHSALNRRKNVLTFLSVWACGPHEIVQGKNLIEAAKATGIQHFVWSTLDHGYLPHFDSKAQVDDALKASGIPRTSIYTCSYIDNACGPMYGWKKDPKLPGGVLLDNKLAATDGRTPVVYSKDVGAWAAAAFLHPEQWIGE